MTDDPIVQAGDKTRNPFPAGNATPARNQMQPTSRVVVKRIGHDTPAYGDMVALRYRVLREPLGLSYTPEQLQAEAADTLLCACIGDALAGCLILTRLDARAVQMRQVAVAPHLQGQGVGRALVACAEQTARTAGHAAMLLHARESAVPFYLRLGYVAEGDPFEEVGLPHRAMRKDL